MSMCRVFSCVVGRGCLLWTVHSLGKTLFASALLHSVLQGQIFPSVQFSHSVVSDSVTSWIAACQASLSITNSRSLLKLMSIELVMPSSHLILCHPLLLPSVFPSIRVFSNESTLRLRWPKYWSFSFSISSSNEHPGLISFSMDWLDLLEVQGTLKSLCQHHSSNISLVPLILLKKSLFLLILLFLSVSLHC